VLRGPYRHVRNPMITAVTTILLGETCLAGSPALLLWTALFFTLNAVWIPTYEEPTLARRFGEEYRDYSANVRRWLPRRTAWEPRREEQRARDRDERR
jgi:protein-S-isoprenylcysteine O-methyltransferase Ste14